MNRSEIQSLITTATYQGETMEGEVEETHISWIIFGKNHVFKIKKPVKLSFLDFSSLEKRRHFCERELGLNRRFSRIYLEVLPVKNAAGRWSLGNGEGETKDYAVVMERMESSKRMDKMLAEDRVRQEDMQALAKEVAGFHQKATVIHAPFDLGKTKFLFQDIRQISDFVEEFLGPDAKKSLLRSLDWSDHFLEKHAERIRERHQKGLVRDLHGDMHGGNIFLYPKPILFDCIEFSDEYRQIDVLYEIAFLCMEMEVGGHGNLSDCFIKHYLQIIPCIETPEDKALYLYFKCLRASIRAKVLALGEINRKPKGLAAGDLAPIQHYLDVMNKYMQETDL